MRRRTRFDGVGEARLFFLKKIKWVVQEVNARC